MVDVGCQLDGTQTPSGDELLSVTMVSAGLGGVDSPELWVPLFHRFSPRLDKQRKARREPAIISLRLLTASAL